MKSFKLSVLLSLVSAVFAPVILNAQGAVVVAEDPDGGIVVRAGSSMALSPGGALQAGDLVKSNGATLILSICDGSLITVYPNSEIMVNSLGTEVAMISLIKGE